MMELFDILFFISKAFYDCFIIYHAFEPDFVQYLFDIHNFIF